MKAVAVLQVLYDIIEQLRELGLDRVEEGVIGTALDIEFRCTLFREYLQ